MPLHPRVVAFPARHVAVVEVTDLPPRPVLATLLEQVPPDVSLIGFVPPSLSVELRNRILVCPVPAARGIAVTDAVKRVEGGRVVETIDRTRLVTLDLPVVVPVPALRRWLASGEAAPTVAALVAMAESPPTLVDDRGAPLGPGGDASPSGSGADEEIGESA